MHLLKFLRRTVFLFDKKKKKKRTVWKMAPNQNYILTDASGEPVSRTYQYRKVMKPMLERKRRARINRCLDELKELMTNALQTVSIRHFSFSFHLFQFSSKWFVFWVSPKISEFSCTVAFSRQMLTAHFNGIFSKCKSKIFFTFWFFSLSETNY